MILGLYIRIIIGHGTYVATQGSKIVISFHICHLDPQSKSLNYSILQVDCAESVSKLICYTTKWALFFASVIFSLIKSCLISKFYNEPEIRAVYR